MPRLSIIIPTLGHWPALETTLVSVLQNRPHKCEVIVVVNQRYDDPYSLSEEVRFVEATNDATLVDLVNHGFIAARSELLHVLVAGAVVGDGWTETALRHFADPQVAAVAPLVLNADNPRQVLTAGCTWSRGGNTTNYGAGRAPEQIVATGRDWLGPNFAAGFYRRSALAEVATLDATLPAELAAVDLALQLRRSGWRSALETNCHISIAAEVVHPHRPMRNAHHRERLFWRYLSDGATLGNVVAHVGHVAIDLLQHLARPHGLGRPIGRLLGACDLRKARRTVLPQTAEPERAQPAQHTGRRVDAAHERHQSKHGESARSSATPSAGEARP